MIHDLPGTSQAEAVTRHPVTLFTNFHGPLRFEPNVGQVDGRVNFLSRGANYSLLLSPTEAILELPRVDENVEAIRMELVGANPAAVAKGVNLLRSFSNYFIGNNKHLWRQNVPHFAKVEFENVYPGINLAYYGNEGRMEYDFIVLPGGNVESIQVRYRGIDKVEIDNQGDLVLHSQDLVIRQEKPTVYTLNSGVKAPVSCAYIVKNGNEIRFQLEKFDARKVIVIDPAVTFSSYLGGTESDEGTAIAVDSSGNIYLTGFTLSSDFPKLRAVQSRNRGGQDAFVAKILVDGNLSYVTYLGGDGRDEGMGIAADAAGNAYVTGETQSANFPTRQAFQSTLRGPNDAFIVKLNDSGSQLLYSTYFGGSSGEAAAAITVDSIGNMYLAGGTDSLDFPLVHPFQSGFGGSSDAFVCKLNSSGSALIYSSYLGGNGGDAAYSIALDISGKAYLAGITDSTNFPVAHAFQQKFGGLFDAFVAKVSEAGSTLVFSSYLGGRGFDAAHGIAVSSSNKAHIAGFTNSKNFPTKRPFQRSRGGTSLDAFVVKMNRSGNSLVYSTYFGGSQGPDAGRSIAVDRKGNAYVTGKADSDDFPVLKSLQRYNNGASHAGDAFVAKFNRIGKLKYSTLVGGDFDETGLGIAVDSLGTAYITGTTDSFNFPVFQPFQEEKSGTLLPTDAFVTRISPNP